MQPSESLPLLSSTYLLFIYLYMVVPLAPIIYILVKWQSYRESLPKDSQIGVKVLLFYFRTLAYHVVLAAVAALLFGVLEGKSDVINVALGLFIGGVVVYGLHVFLIGKLTNTGQFPMVARMYTGFNIIIVGLVGMVSFIFTIVLLLKGGVKVLEFPLSVFVVYCIAWIYQVYTLFRSPTFKPTTTD